MQNQKSEKFDSKINDSALISLLDYLEDGVCMFDAEQRLVACNDKYVEMYNLPAYMGNPGTTLMEILIKRISENTSADISAEAYIANRMKAVYDAVERTDIQHMRDGRVFSVRHKPLADGGWLTTHTDISEIYDLKREVEYMAYHDQLTGVANRRSLECSIEQELTSCKRGRYVGLMFLDLDGFKPVNDQYGHEAGDEVLKTVSQRLKEKSEDTGIVGRMGGDEFAILHSEITNIRDYGAIAQNVIDHVSTPISIVNQEVTVGVSIGVVCTDRPDSKANRLWNLADKAMYHSKRNGGRQYTMCGYED